MPNHIPDTNRSKAVVATKGPTLSAAATEGLQNHQTNPSGINAQIQGCDYHPGFQQIACADTETGEVWGTPPSSRGHARWFERGVGFEPTRISSRPKRMGSVAWCRNNVNRGRTCYARNVHGYGAT